MGGPFPDILNTPPFRSCWSRDASMKTANMGSADCLTAPTREIRDELNIATD